jgi:hypothetical protein
VGADKSSDDPAGEPSAQLTRECRRLEAEFDALLLAERESAAGPITTATWFTAGLTFEVADNAIKVRPRGYSAWLQRGRGMS